MLTDRKNFLFIYTQLMLKNRHTKYQQSAQFYLTTNGHRQKVTINALHQLAIRSPALHNAMQRRWRKTPDNKPSRGEERTNLDCTAISQGKYCVTTPARSEYGSPAIIGSAKREKRRRKVGPLCDEQTRNPAPPRQTQTNWCGIWMEGLDYPPPVPGLIDECIFIVHPFANYWIGRLLFA